MKNWLKLGDKTAIILSVLCVLHCIATPLLFIALPSAMAAITFNPEIIHFALLFVIIPVSVLSIAAGYYQHRHNATLGLGLLGLLTLIAAVIFGHDLFAGKGEVVLTLVGSALVVFAHILNIRNRVLASEASMGNSAL